jgi:hypothetical protein
VGEQDERPFSVDAGVMRVNKELDEVEPEEFADAVRHLVRSGAAAPVLDIAGLNFLPSYHIDGIRAAAEEALHEGRSLTVLAKRNVGVLLERMGLGAVARVKSSR